MVCEGFFWRLCAPRSQPIRIWQVGTYSWSVRLLTIAFLVDGSIIEVYANDVTVVTTRAYPWLSASTGVAYLVMGGSPEATVSTSGVELWDGLLNAWPNRPADTSRPLTWDGPVMTGLGAIWAGN
jgi:beta-fructofuranosidase